MPTEIHAAACRPLAPLSWGDTARVLWLLWRAHRLRRRMTAAGNRPLGRAPGELLHIARAWIACHERISAILGDPEPPQVRQVRASMRERRP